MLLNIIINKNFLRFSYSIFKVQNNFNKQYCNCDCTSYYSENFIMFFTFAIILKINFQKQNKKSCNYNNSYNYNFFQFNL